MNASDTTADPVTTDARTYALRCPRCGHEGSRRFTRTDEGALEDVLSQGLRFDDVTRCHVCEYHGTMERVAVGTMAERAFASEAEWRREVMSEARQHLAEGDPNAAWSVLNAHETDGYPWWPGDRAALPSPCN